MRRYRDRAVPAVVRVLIHNRRDRVPLLTIGAWFGSMAITMMGGLLVATILTLLFLPALYAAWFRVRKTTAEPAASPLPLPKVMPPPLSLVATPRH